MRVATQRAATVQLNIELVVVTTGTIDVDAERIVSKPYFVRRKRSKQEKRDIKIDFSRFLVCFRIESTGGVNDATERAVESQSDFHVIILTLGIDTFEIFKIRLVSKLHPILIYILLLLKTRVMLKR